MKALDVLLQNWRIAKARPYVAPGANVLDIGSADGALYRRIPGIGAYTGLDPEAPPGREQGPMKLLKGAFPDDLPPLDVPFDAITMLAVLEHFPAAAQKRLGAFCADSLKPGGFVVVTVPDPAVDRILDVLIALRVLDGMEADEHYGFDVRETPSIFVGAGLSQVTHERFQLGLNNLFVFRKP